MISGYYAKISFQSVSFSGFRGTPIIFMNNLVLRTKYYICYMIIVADSGSTKTNWYSPGFPEEQKTIQTSGMNPLFRPVEELQAELRKVLVPKITEPVAKVFFYGAGIISEKAKEKVIQSLSVLFPGAEVFAESDLVAAARSLFGKKTGMACILGTGANSCLYDGNSVIQHIPPLGYVLGDEGSGAWLGKRILSDFLKGMLPAKLEEAFVLDFGNDYPNFMNKVYKESMPGSYLAGFTRFLAAHQKDEYVHDIINESFELFVKRNVLLYSEYADYEIGFVGSIASVFSKNLEETFRKFNLEITTILQDPLENLAAFHMLDV